MISVASLLAWLLAIIQLLGILSAIRAVMDARTAQGAIAWAIALIAFEGVRMHDVARAPSLPPVPFPKPVAQAGVPFVSFQDPRASVVFGNPNPYGTALVQPVAAGR